MDKLFLVELSGGNIRHCELELPATDYELLDALDKLRLSEADKLYFDICDYYGYNYLAPFISDTLNLYELNALSRKLADLNPTQQTAFAGLLKMEVEKRDGDILVPKLIDLAYSVDCCHVVAEALNDSQLGRFYADNGFIPLTENVPDSVYELLDFEALGRKARNEEGGVFVDRDTYGCFGYVVRHTDLVEAYDNARNWRALINASVCEIAAAYKIQPDHLRWYAAFHQKSQQMHIHMIIFSTDPKEGYLTKDGIRQVKSAFARRIYQADRMHIYQQKDQSRDALQREARRAMAECIDQLKCGTICDSKLEQLITELANRLQETRGRKVYGYLPPRTKAIVDAIVEELAKDQQVSAAYEVWQTLYEQICLDYNEQLPKRLPLSQQKEFKTVRNMVIQETLQWMSERQQYAEALAGNPAAPEMPGRSAPTENTPTTFSEPENPGTPPSTSTSESTDASAGASRPDSTDLPPSEGERPGYEPPQSDVQSRTAGSTYDPPTVGEAVVRMLHHMSRIFEDNSRTDRIHRGLQIDRKRRQELQRKRLAVGHKADDHEEQSLSSL